MKGLRFILTLYSKRKKKNEYVRSLVITIPIPFQKIIIISHLSVASSQFSIYKIVRSNFRSNHTHVSQNQQRKSVNYLNRQIRSDYGSALHGSFPQSSSPVTVQHYRIRTYQSKHSQTADLGIPLLVGALNEIKVEKGKAYSHANVHHSILMAKNETKTTRLKR